MTVPEEKPATQEIRFSVRGKIVSIVLLVVCTLMALVLAAVVMISWRNSEAHLRALEQQIRADLYTKARLLTTSHATALRSLALDNAISDVRDIIKNAVGEDRDVVYGVYISADDHVWACQAPVGCDKEGTLAAFEIPANDRVLKETKFRWHHFNSAEILELAVPVTDRAELLGTLRYGLSTQRIQRALQEARAANRQELRWTILLLISFVFAAGVIGVLLGHRVAKRIVDPLLHLTHAVQRLGAGDLEAKVSIQSSDELAVLGAAFNQLGSELEVARGQLQEKARLARDMEIASGIQRALLPPPFSHPELEIAGRMTPADEIGGDFYDVLASPHDETLWITIGDVSGHGISAGLIMLMTQSAFSTVRSTSPDALPDDVLRAVNRALCENISNRMSEDKYVTGLLFTYVGKGRFLFAGAHPAPIIFRANNRGTLQVETNGSWLGIEPEMDSFPVSELVLAKGDILCLYSDGITEAPGSDGEMFEAVGLERALVGAIGDGGSSLQDIAERTADEVERFATARPDDRTLLLIRYVGA